MYYVTVAYENIYLHICMCINVFIYMLVHIISTAYVHVYLGKIYVLIIIFLTCTHLMFGLLKTANAKLPLTINMHAKFSATNFENITEIIIILLINTEK